MPRPTIDRRGFLGSSAAAAAVLALHDVSALAAVPARGDEAAGRPRLLALELRSGAPLAEMKAFYGKTLDLGVRDERADRFTVDAGETRLTFVHDAQIVDGRAPFYHFAFNIPENKIVQALAWQKARTPLLPIPERNRAAGMPPEVVDYRHWNAHSIFFQDPAGNVVEYIARHDLKNGDPHPFSWGDILYASEIGLIVDDVAATSAALQDVAGLAPYKGASEGFTAMGDEYGLLLVMQRGRVLDFTGNEAHGARVYPTGVTVRGAKGAQHQLGSYPYRLAIEERCSCA
jgi:hypothetical protein